MSAEHPPTARRPPTLASPHSQRSWRRGRPHRRQKIRCASRPARRCCGWRAAAPGLWPAVHPAAGTATASAPCSGGRGGPPGCPPTHPPPSQHPPDLVGVQRGEGVQGGVGGDGEGVEAAQGSLRRQGEAELSPPPPQPVPFSQHGADRDGGGSSRCCLGTQHQAETLPTRCTHRHPNSNNPQALVGPKAGGNPARPPPCRNPSPRHCRHCPGAGLSVVGPAPAASPPDGPSRPSARPPRC